MSTRYKFYDPGGIFSQSPLTSDSERVKRRKEQIQKEYANTDHGFFASMSRALTTPLGTSKSGQTVLDNNPKGYNGPYKGLGEGASFFPYGLGPSLPHEGLLGLGDYLNYLESLPKDSKSNMTVDEYFWRGSHPFTNPSKYPGRGNW